MKVKRGTRIMVRYWVPRFRKADMEALTTYERFADALYVRAEAEIISRVCRSEMRRRKRANREGQVDR